MAFTRRSLEAVLDLLENKITSMEVHDRHDERTFRDLDAARVQIAGMLKPATASQGLSVVASSASAAAFAVAA